MGEDELEVSVGSDNLTVKGKGGEIGRVTGMLVDMLSPFSESAGAVGDMVRVYRQQNAIRALAAVKELAAKLGVEIKPVAPKFLVQWVEGVSLEEPGKDDLSELWVGLLLNANDGVRPTHLLFKRMLTEMNGRHVELLRWLCDFDQATNSFNFAAMDESAKRYNEYFKDDGKTREFPSDESEDVPRSLETINAPGLKLVTFSFHEAGALGLPGPGLSQRQHTNAVTFLKDHSFEYLKLSGLVGEVSRSMRAKMTGTEPPVQRVINVKVWYLTSLGREFLETCHANSRIARMP